MGPRVTPTTLAHLVLVYGCHGAHALPLPSTTVICLKPTLEEKPEQLVSGLTRQIS